MDLTKLDGLINTFGTEFIDKMKSELQANGSIATGTLSNSFNYKFAVGVDEIIIQFLSEDYGKYVESGRQAGTYPNVSRLQQWLTVKGIPLKASFPIAKKIYKYGIKPKPFMFNDFENAKHDFIIALMAVYGSLVKIELTDFFNQIPKQVP